MRKKQKRIGKNNELDKNGQAEIRLTISYRRVLWIIRCKANLIILD